jgi:MSHA biogenesis protein MshQ
VTRGSASSLGLGAVDKPASPATATALTTRLAMVPSAGAASGSWNAGVGDFSGYFAAQRAATPDGPYASVKLGIYPTDADGVVPSTLTLDADLNGSNERVDLGISTALRYGRIHILNAYGSELLSLPIPVYAEYYTGSGYAPNTADSCTSLALTPSASSAPTSYRWGDLTLSNAQRNLAVNATRPGTATNPLPLASGSALVSMSAPGNGKDGSLDLSLTVPAWLQYDWNGDGSYGDAPSGRAVFGIYKSAIIDQREKF